MICQANAIQYLVLPARAHQALKHARQFNFLLFKASLIFKFKFLKDVMATNIMTLACRSHNAVKYNPQKSSTLKFSYLIFYFIQLPKKQVGSFVQTYRANATNRQAYHANHTLRRNFACNFSLKIFLIVVSFFFLFFFLLRCPSNQYFDINDVMPRCSKSNKNFYLNKLHCFLIN